MIADVRSAWPKPRGPEPRSGGGWGNRANPFQRRESSEASRAQIDQPVHDHVRILLLGREGLEPGKVQRRNGEVSAHGPSPSDRVAVRVHLRHFRDAREGLTHGAQRQVPRDVPDSNLARGHAWVGHTPQLQEVHAECHARVGEGSSHSSEKLLVVWLARVRKRIEREGRERSRGHSSSSGRSSSRSRYRRSSQRRRGDSGATHCDVENPERLLRCVVRARSAREGSDGTPTGLNECREQLLQELIYYRFLQMKRPFGPSPPCGYYTSYADIIPATLRT